MRNLGSHPRNVATGQCKETLAEFELKWYDNKIIFCLENNSNAFSFAQTSHVNKNIPALLNRCDIIHCTQFIIVQPRFHVTRNMISGV